MASIRHMLRSQAYAGTAFSGRQRSVPAQRRKSAMLPVGSGQSIAPAPEDEWIAVSVPAIITMTQYEAAQHRLEENKQTARRNNKTHQYLLRGLVSCGQCRLSASGKERRGYLYYVCRGHDDALRKAKDERCTARYAPVAALDQLVWQDLCRILQDPTIITSQLQRAQSGAWLPQALQARLKTVNQALKQLERQQTRLLDLFLAEVIERAEFERKRHELAQTKHGLEQQLRQLEAQAQKQIDTLELSQNIAAFCQRLQPTLEQLNFDQRRKLVELLIDRVIIDDENVEIRYVIPTSPQGEISRFCHLRLNYFDLKSQFVKIDQFLPCKGKVG